MKVCSSQRNKPNRNIDSTFDLNIPFNAHFNTQLLLFLLGLLAVSLTAALWKEGGIKEVVRM